MKGDKKWSYKFWGKIENGSNPFEELVNIESKKKKDHTYNVVDLTTKRADKILRILERISCQKLAKHKEKGIWKNWEEYGILIDIEQSGKENEENTQIEENIEQYESQIDLAE